VLALTERDEFPRLDLMKIRQIMARPVIFHGPIVSSRAAVA